MSDKKPWEDFAQNTNTDSKPWQDFGGESKADDGNAVTDIGKSLAKGTHTAFRGIVGLADFVAGSNIGRNIKNAGYDAKAQEDLWQESKSAALKQKEQELQNKQGFIDTAKYAITNPTLIANQVAESLPAMITGGGLGGGVGRMVGLNAAARGALAEGLQQTGTTYSDAQIKNNYGEVSDREKIAALGSGATTGALGFMGGKLAGKLGIGDVDAAIASRMAGEVDNVGKPLGLGGYAKAIGKSALSEGVFEEMPQSATETMWQNYAEGKPIMEGVANAAAIGALTGAAMGGTFTAARGFTNQRPLPPQDPRASTPYTRSGVAEIINPNTPRLGFDPYGTQGQPQQIPFVPSNGQFSVSPDGVIYGDGNINDYLRGKTEQDIYSREANRPKEVNDVTPVPQGYDSINDGTLALPRPPNDFVIDNQGNVLTPSKFNQRLSEEQQANAINRDNAFTGMPNDPLSMPQAARGFGLNRPQTPSEQLGIDPNQGSLSTAATVAVDTGASPITAALQQQALQSQGDTQANWLSNIAAPQVQGDIPQLGYNPQNDTTTQNPVVNELSQAPQAQSQVADLWNSQDPQTRMSILGAINDNQDQAMRQLQQRFENLPTEVQQHITSLAVQSGAISEQPSNGQESQAAPMAAPSDTPTQNTTTNQANTAPTIEPILGKDGKNKWFATQNKADEFIQKKNLGDNYTIEQTGKMRYEIVPKVQPQTVQQPQSKVNAPQAETSPQGYSLPSDINSDWQKAGNKKPIVTTRQKQVIEAVQEAQASGLSDDTDIANHVAEKLGVTDMQRQEKGIGDISKFDLDVISAIDTIAQHDEKTLGKALAKAQSVESQPQQATTPKVSDILSDKKDLGNGMTAFAFDSRSLNEQAPTGQQEKQPIADVVKKYKRDDWQNNTMKVRELAKYLKRYADLPADQAKRLEKAIENQATDKEGLFHAVNSIVSYGEAVANKDGNPNNSTSYSPVEKRVPEGKRNAGALDIYGDWHGSLRDDYTLTPRQETLIKATQQAIDEGNFYNKDVNKRVAEILNVPKDVLEQNTNNVEGGDFGQDVYYARQYIEKKQAIAINNQAKEKLGLKQGDKIGTVVTNTGNTLKNVVVQEVHDGSVTVHASSGNKRQQYTVGYDDIDTSIERAVKEGKRQPFIKDSKPANVKEGIEKVRAEKTKSADKGSMFDAVVNEQAIKNLDEKTLRDVAAMFDKKDAKPTNTKDAIEKIQAEKKAAKNPIAQNSQQVDNKVTAQEQEQDNVTDTRSANEPLSGVLARTTPESMEANEPNTADRLPAENSRRSGKNDGSLHSPELDNADDGTIASDGRYQDDLSVGVEPKTADEAVALSIKEANEPTANFTLTTNMGIGKGSMRDKLAINLDIMDLLRLLETENRKPTVEEKTLMAKYTGFGGLSDAFPNSNGEFKKGWEELGNRLKNTLTPEQYKTARASTTSAFFTPPSVIQAMWDIAERLGYNGGMVLEPSIGIGSFIGFAPKKPQGFIGSEIDGTTFAIAKHLYPQANLFKKGYETLPVADNSIDLAIGNPPYGSVKLNFVNKPHLNGKTIANQFMISTLEQVKPNGLSIMVVSSNFMDSTNTANREEMAKLGNLEYAIRLPNSTFDDAGTAVVADILVFRKHDQATLDAITQDGLSNMPSWVKTSKISLDGINEVNFNPFFNDKLAGELQAASGEGGRAIYTIKAKGSIDKALKDFVKSIEKVKPTKTVKQIEKEINTTNQSMIDSLVLEAEGNSIGDIRRNENGRITQVIERTDGITSQLVERELLPSSVWGDSYTQDLDGRWYKIEDVKDKKGKSVKVLDKDGKPTKANLKQKVYFADDKVPAQSKLGIQGYNILSRSLDLLGILENQLQLEQSANSDSKTIEANRKELAKEYNAFVKTFGYLNNPRNAKFIKQLPKANLVFALEKSYTPEKSTGSGKNKNITQKEVAKASDILIKRMIVPKSRTDHVETAKEALTLSLAYRGKVDIDLMAELTGKPPQFIISELNEIESPVIFNNPATNEWETADEYLSGNIREKIKDAEQLGLAKNVQALEAVLPSDVPVENIAMRLGMNWIPAEIYTDFAKHLLGTNAAKVSYEPISNTYSVTGSSTQARHDEFMGGGKSPEWLLERILNNRKIEVKQTDYLTKKTILLVAETEEANEKAQAIKGEFENWLYTNGDTVAKLAELFNKVHNAIVERKFDGSHLELSGKVPDDIIKLRTHQNNAVWRGVTTNAVLYDHAVGSGKTFTGIARAMERKHLGLSKKPVLVVPNHMVNQFAQDIYKLYPAANILTAGKKDFEKKNRKKLFGKIATNDYDIIVLPHSSFEFIKLSKETQKRYLEEEKAKIEQAIIVAKAESGSKDMTTKQLETLRANLETKIKRLTETKRNDDEISFEQMGIDDITVDEAHEFKNLFFTTKMQGVKGLGTPTGSNKAMDLWLKTKYIHETGGALAFMTGTPISNSAAEMHAMMRYLMPKTLEDNKVINFDAWANTYAENKAKFEATESGRLKLTTRFAREWQNMGSLMAMWRTVTDSVTNDDIKATYRAENNGAEFPLPRVAGGNRQPVSVKPTTSQEHMLELILAGFKMVEHGNLDKEEKAILRLKLMDLATKNALDPRIIDPTLEAGGKLQAVADNTFEIYQKWNKDKGTQIIFLDRSMPKSKSDAKVIAEYDAVIAERDKAIANNDDDALLKANDKLEKFDENEIAELKSAQNGGFNAYDEIKRLLIVKGVPANEIVFIQEANTDEEKKAIFDKVNSGEIRIILGSTPRMGAGTNIQERLVALHHVDAPWKPSDIEQREGRIIRQGNKLYEKYGHDNFEVEIKPYITEKTADAKRWDTMSAKLGTINAIRNYKGEHTLDFEEDDGDASFQEIAALATGNPLMLERMELTEVRNRLNRALTTFRKREAGDLGRLKSAQQAVERLPKRIESAKSIVSDYEAIAAIAKAEYDKQAITIDGKVFNTRKSANAYAKEKAELAKQADTKATYVINGENVGSYTAADTKIKELIGSKPDVPMLLEVNGKQYNNPSDMMTNDLMNKVNSHSVQPVFKLMGLDVTSYDDGGMTLMVVERGEQVLAQRSLDKQATGIKIINVINDLAKQLDSKIPFLEDNLQRALQSNQQTIESLQDKVGKPFPEQGQLNTVSERLTELQAVLGEAEKPELTDIDKMYFAELNDVLEGMSNRRSNVKPLDNVVSGNDSTDERQYSQNGARSQPTPQSEIDQVRSQYEGTDQWMKAPNGQPTNLTEQQWLQVRTPSFKAWFGDWENYPADASKVVDENGEPMVVYHGTLFDDAAYKFTVFNDKNHVFFSPSKQTALWYGHEDGGLLFDVFLNIKKIKKIDANNNSHADLFPENTKYTYQVLPIFKAPLPRDIENKLNELAWIRYDSLEKAELAKKQVESLGIQTEEILIEADYDTTIDTRQFAKQAEHEGFDGVFITNVQDPMTTDVVIAFKANQIKSATDNIGTFNPESDDIRYSQNGARSQTTKKQVIDTLSAKFGRDTINKLIKDGALEVIDYAEALRRDPQTPSKADGFYLNGKATLIADNLDPSMIVPTFLHELGGHGGLQTLMSDKAYQSLMREFDAMVKRGDKIAVDAKNLADAHSPNAKVAQDEYLPYLISLASRSRGNSKIKSMLNRIVMAVKSFIRDKFGVNLKVTPADIVALSEKMVQQRAAMGANITNQAARYSKPTPQSEIDQVRQQYQGTDQWMKAPNGSPTNLTEKQWLQVRTPGFKAWFGDWENGKDHSEIVDNNGEPMVVRHFTDSNFTTFDSKKSDGFWFTDKKDIDDDVGAFGSGNVIEAFLNIRNSILNGSNYDIEQQLLDEDADGIINKYDGFTDYAVANPNQIKSATDNIGTFNPENDDIRYSQMGGLQAQQNKLAKVLTEFFKNPLSFVKTVADNKVTDHLGKGLALLGRRQLVDIYKNDLPDIKLYSDTVEQMDADSNEKASEADKLVKEWAKLKDELPLAELMHDATLKGIDPAEPYQAGDDRAIYQQLKRRYDALSPDAQRIYKQARDDYKAHQRSVFNAIKGRIQRSSMSAPRQAELIKKMEQGFFFGQKVYFPLARFGKYVIVVKDSAGNVINASRAETSAQAEALRKELLAAYPNDKVGRVILDKEFVGSRDGVSRGFMSDLFDAVADLGLTTQQQEEFEDTLGQLYLNSLPDMHFAKSGIHRKGTAGFSQNARRAYAQHMSRGSHYVAKMRHADVLSALLDDMQDYVKQQGESDPNYDQPKMQRVVDEMEKRHDLLMNPKTHPAASFATSIGFIWYMGLSPASAIVNLSQTVLVAYPVMGAKWGFGKAGAELAKLSQDAAMNKNDLGGILQGDEKKAFDEAVRRGVIDLTQAHDLAGIAQGEDEKVMWYLHPIMKAASFMFHHAEKFNRQVTFVAAYRLARQAGTDHKAAVEQAIDATYEGHFSYASSNRPRIMQGNWQRVLFLFKQYGQNMTYSLARNAYLSFKGDKQAMKALGGMLALHGTFAGVLGLPMASTLLAVASSLGGGDDEPWDAEIALRNLLAEMFGDTASEVISKGLPRAAGIDLSSRVGLDSLILPRFQEGLEGQREGENILAGLAGPVAGIGVNTVAGMDDIKNGNTLIGIEKMLPKVLKDSVKTFRYATEGIVDKTGIEIMPQESVSTSDIAQQAIGFRSARIAQAQEGKSAIFKMDKEIGKRRQRLMDEYARAKMSGDDTRAEEIWQDIKRFNEGIGDKYPKLRITKVKLMQSIKQRKRRIAEAENGIYLPSSRTASRDYGAFATDE